MIATDALGEEDDLHNYIYLAIWFTFALPPKNVKQMPKTNQPQS